MSFGPKLGPDFRVVIGLYFFSAATENVLFIFLYSACVNYIIIIFFPQTCTGCASLSNDMLFVYFCIIFFFVLLEYS